MSEEDNKQDYSVVRFRGLYTAAFNKWIERGQHKIPAIESSLGTAARILYRVWEDFRPDPLGEGAEAPVYLLALWGDELKTVPYSEYTSIVHTQSDYSWEDNYPYGFLWEDNYPYGLRRTGEQLETAVRGAILRDRALVGFLSIQASHTLILDCADGKTRSVK